LQVSWTGVCCVKFGWWRRSWVDVVRVGRLYIFLMGVFFDWLVVWFGSVWAGRLRSMRLWIGCRFDQVEMLLCFVRVSI
jgi:hypothetical protein